MAGDNRGRRKLSWVHKGETGGDGFARREVGKAGLTRNQGSPTWQAWGEVGDLQKGEQEWAKALESKTKFIMISAQTASLQVFELQLMKGA